MGSLCHNLHHAHEIMKFFKELLVYVYKSLKWNKTTLLMRGEEHRRT